MHKVNAVIEQEVKVTIMIIAHLQCQCKKINSSPQPDIILI